MPKRNGSSSKYNNNRNKRQAVAVPTKPMLVPTGTGPQKDMRLIMERVYAQSKTTENTSESASNTCYWSSSQETNFLRLCIQEPSLVTSIFIIHGNYVTPLPFLIQFRAKLSLVQVYCKKFPHALEITNKEDMNPLQIACAKPDVVPGIVAFLAKSYPLAAFYGLFFHERRSRFSIKSALAFLLNKINRDGSGSNAQNLEDFKAVFDAVKRNDYVDAEEYQTLFFHWVAINSDDNCYKNLDLMQIVVERCPNISNMEIMAKQGPFLGEDVFAITDISSRVVLLTPQLQELDLDIDLTREDLGAWQAFMRAVGNASGLQALKLWIMDWPEEEEQKELFAAALYDALGRIPNLKKLYLQGCHDVRFIGEGVSDGLGDILAGILRRNSLEKMIVFESEPEPKHEPILAALKDNRSLTCLGITSCYDTEAKRKALRGLLAEKNTTLEHVIDFDDSSYSMIDIHYQCILNSLGRGMARDPLTPSAAFVALLEEAVEADPRPSQDPFDSKFDPDYMFDEEMTDSGVGLGFIYGLLRECPSIWCR